MLKFFARNKLVSIFRKDDDILVAHGLLEDDILRAGSGRGVEIF